MQTQTEELVTRVAITQTATVEYEEMDCQTEDVQTLSKGIQADFKKETCEIGLDPI